MVDHRVLLVSVGNTRTRMALWTPTAQAQPDERPAGAAGAPSAAAARKAPPTGLDPSVVATNDPRAELHTTVLAQAARLGDPAQHREGGPRVAIASVRDSVADGLAEALTAAGHRVVRMVSPGRDGGGRGLAVPIRHALPAPVTVGVDRLLAALGASSRSGEACVVIDAGTAVTADFVDQWGTFQGGAIAPGLSAMLAAMHASAEGLPAVELPRAAAEVPAGPWATTTRDAMVLGALLAVRGMAHRAIERYALAHGSYPRVIATGGDAPLLFGEDELVEHIVPDLVLLGMAAAWWSEFGG